MRIDLALDPFDADVADMVAVGRVVDRHGGCGIWLADHFSGRVVGRSWSRDPFVSLGAIAATTSRIDLGILVANVVNRHPAQLASAVNSLQSLAPGRIRLGVGSGAAPGSRFAVEHEAIGRVLPGADERRRILVDSIGMLRSIWGSGFDGLPGLVDDSPPPPIIVGASAWPTIAVALSYADGVNVRWSSDAPDLLERIAAERDDGFEVSVLDSAVRFAAGDVDSSRLVSLGCDRLILGLSAPYDRRLVDVVLDGRETADVRDP